MPGRLPLPCDPGPARWPVEQPRRAAPDRLPDGDFAPFRHALLRHLAGETELDIWQPTAGSDLGLQVLDWWAYIADILTFYNERIANEDYLGTASLDTSVRRLVGLLGYRPRPGIGATGAPRRDRLRHRPAAHPRRTRHRIEGHARAGLPDVRDHHRQSPSTQPTSVPGPAPDNLDRRAARRRAAQQRRARRRRAAGARPADRPRRGAASRAPPTSIAAGDRLLLIAEAWSSPATPPPSSR